MAAPIEEQVVAALRSLPPHQKQEVLDFAQFLSTKSAESRDRSVGESRSALDLVQQWVGCIEDSPEDLYRKQTDKVIPVITPESSK